MSIIIKACITKFCFIIFLAVIISEYLPAQLGYSLSDITEIRWELDYEVYLKMENDSAFTYDISQLFHVQNQKRDTSADFIFYPVNLDEQYVNNVNATSPGGNDTVESAACKTLWSALHYSIGGGWVHFMNCLLYALESGQLQLDAPLMQRNKTSWKPDPITDSYLRTRKWDYYIPLDQKLAIKEYKIRIQRDEPGDLKNLPEEFIQLFLKTSNKDYQKLINNKEANTIAKIDLVKILLGANFLGEIQINYISNQVLNSVKNYSLNRLPSVLIFDEYNAAAAISIDPDGYRIKALAFKSSANLSEEQMNKYKHDIIKIVDNINIHNQKAFRKKLKNYYSR